MVAMKVVKRLLPQASQALGVKIYTLSGYGGAAGGVAVMVGRLEVLLTSDEAFATLEAILLRTPRGCCEVEARVR